LLKFNEQLADIGTFVDQEKIEDLPVGDREYSHLRPAGLLNEHSCEVELCRADAKGVGNISNIRIDTHKRKEEDNVKVMFLL